MGASKRLEILSMAFVGQPKMFGERPVCHAKATQKPVTRKPVNVPSVTQKPSRKSRQERYPALRYLLQIYSVRNASMGSTEAARRAGTKAAHPETTANAAIASPKLAGSNAEIP